MWLPAESDLPKQWHLVLIFQQFRLFLRSCGMPCRGRPTLADSFAASWHACPCFSSVSLGEAVRLAGNAGMHVADFDATPGTCLACVAGDDEEDAALEEAAAQARKERAIAASAYGHRASGAAGDIMTRSQGAAGLC